MQSERNLTPLPHAETAPDRELTVADIMSSPVIAVPATVALSEALWLLAAASIHHIVVMSGGRCHGILPDRLLAAAWADDPGDFDRRQVGEVLPDFTPAVNATASIAAAARMMRRTGQDAVLAVDAVQHVVGIVTAADLVAVLAELPRTPTPAVALAAASATAHDGSSAC